MRTFLSNKLFFAILFPLFKEKNSHNQNFKFTSKARKLFILKHPQAYGCRRLPAPCLFFQLPVFIPPNNG